MEDIDVQNETQNRLFAAMPVNLKEEHGDHLNGMWECENVSGNMNLWEIFGKTPKNIPKCWFWFRLAKLHISPSAAFESWLEAGKGE